MENKILKFKKENNNLAYKELQSQLDLVLES